MTVDSADCLFCKIARGEIPADVVAQRDGLLAFNDIHPQAPHHVLVIPTEHVPTVNDLAERHAELVGRMVLLARDVAAERGFAEDGYRLVLNNGRHGGQSVYHLHLHLLGGRYLTWPPG
ncbi:MAG: histidine triad nucleotide-binding protein [Planctomycetota bacterium]|nr:MAG: histidine triad nucleotide-binding protein [Planctomycetota bacterium]